jgi:hypothetical protein
MVCVMRYPVDQVANSLRLEWRAGMVFSSALFFAATVLPAQCPDTGETKVIKPQQGSGYYFYKLLGDSSFVYFLDGKTFSFNEKNDPGKTFVFIDDFAYEPLLVDQAAVAKYAPTSNVVDVLRAQAKHQQDYFKKAVPSMVITDYGVSARKNPDGSEDRLFYLWKKESPPGSKAATQYLVSTWTKAGVVVLSVMPMKPSVTENDVFSQVEKYISHFDLLSGDRCAKLLSASHP